MKDVIRLNQPAANRRFFLYERSSNTPYQSDAELDLMVCLYYKSFGSKGDFDMSNRQFLALCEELERQLKNIEPEDYIAPAIVGVPNGSKVLGIATEQMKRLWTLWSRLEKERCLGETELLKRAVHTAISFEIGKHFNHWRARIGINSSWQVYAMTSQ